MTLRVITLAAICVGICFSGYAQQQARGVVFHDLDGNGQRDQGEPGIAGVAVSNGVEVTKTDAEGRYELSVDNDNIVFVIKPSDYRFPVDCNNLPLFYYIHKPTGSPTPSKYKGVAPTGPLPTSIDFPLISQPEKTSVSALVFGDPQPYNLTELDLLKRGVISEVEGIKGVDFGISLGDIVGNNLDLIPPYIDAMKDIGVPWHNIMGNHDINTDVKSDSLSDETFEAHFGPSNYAFHEGKAYFLLLDNIIFPDPKRGEGHVGGLREDQFMFLENSLSLVDTNKLIILSFHIPLSESTFRKADRERLFGILQPFPHVLMLSAHLHRQQHFFYGIDQGLNRQNPIHEFNVGAPMGNWYSGERNEKGIPDATMTDGTPKGYTFLTINGVEYALDYKVAGQPASYQMTIFNPKVVPHKQKTNFSIYVNFFMGSKDDVVEYRIDGGEWQQMQYVVEHDPSFLYLLHRWDYAEELMPGKRPGPASPSTHLWKTGIPTNFPVGRRVIEVRATDMFGRTFYGESSYRIETPIP